MAPTLKAEFKKLLTVRSTYIMVLLALILTGVFTYFGTSKTVYEEPKDPVVVQQKIDKGEPTLPEDFVTKVSSDLPKEELFMNIQESISVVVIFIAIVVVLLMAHEFRYNTITYTLTASNSRSKVLASKVIVTAVFTVVAALAVIGITVAITYAAVEIKNLNLPQQDFNWAYFTARLLAYALGFTLIALAITALVRNLVAGIAAIFVLPTIDAIGGGLLSIRDIEGAKVLPYSALARIQNISIDYLPKDKLINENGFSQELLSVSLMGAAITFAVYLIGIWAIAWYLFLRRDAS